MINATSNYVGEVKIFDVKPVINNLEKLNADVRFMVLIIYLCDEANSFKFRRSAIALKLGVNKRSVSNWLNNLRDCEVIKFHTENNFVIGMINPSMIFQGSLTEWNAVKSTWDSFRSAA